ncbi:hypothetical protein ACIBL3_23025 [Kribbella sp. NPDC050124]|uniref:hypothetical protein n=1 Tax=Kribbella sp. NPDC050124 TaxID=3364114 RepID=UPI0037995D68
MSTHATSRGAWKHLRTATRTLTGLTACAGLACLALFTAVPAANAAEPSEPPWTEVPTPLPRYPEPSVNEAGLDATSVALGALGGIALGGAGLGITLGVQRRRDHSALHST